MNGVISLVICGALVVTALVIRTGLRTAGRPAVVRSDRTATSLARWRWAGIAMGVLLGGGTIAAGGLGRGPLLASVVFGLSALAGSLIGELLVRPQLGVHRYASVETRAVKGYRPRILGRAATAATATLAVVMMLTTAAGSADDQHRAGRQLSYTPDPTRTTTYGPWPGSYYTVPLGTALLIAALATAIVLVVIARRPVTGDRAADTAQRRRSAQGVTAAWGIAVGVPLIGVSWTAAVALTGIGGAPLWWRMTGWLLFAVAVGGLALVLACWTALFAAPRLVAPAPASA